ncbi:hypothetical protein SAY87_008184 [Trapa incisa]|uniref:Meiosis-specific protein ASY3-like coiled-coil domain-containing protein n=1 Tax=Trapa incisa TaxID=236973 RepID=A0AAN7KHS1_9MYRT|nr:hypothetical protein SAY87_008184 [Trapa incisa]
MSEIQSFGSTCLRHSQTRKISIGVLSEQSVKQIPSPTKGQGVDLAMAYGQQRDSISKEGAQVTTKAKQTEPPEQSGSPWISIKLNNEKSTSPTDFHAKVIGAKTKMGRMCDEPNGFEGRSLDHSMKITHTRNSFLQPDAISGDTIPGKKGDTHTTSQIPPTTAHEQEVVTSKIGDKDGNAVNGKSEALRMKLWELLGTVSSPNKQKHNSQTLEVGADFLQPDGVSKPECTKAVRPRQNSDTIETDSESPQHAKKRPVTRSLARKRASTKLKQVTVQCGMPAYSRQKPGERNIFSFQEGWHVGSRGAATSIRPSTSNRKNNVRKKPQIEPCKSSVQQKMYERKSHRLPKRPVLHADTNGPQLPKYQHLQENVCDPSVKNPLIMQHNQDGQYSQRENSGMEKHKLPDHLKRYVHKIGHATDENDISPAAQKPVSHGSNANRGGIHDRNSNINRKRNDLRTTSIEKDLSENQTRTDYREDFSSPPLPRHQNHREEDISLASPEHQIQKVDVGDTSLKNIMDPQDVAESPTLGTRSPITSPHLGSQKKECPNQNRANGLAEPETMSSGGGIFSFRNFAAKFVPSGHGRDELQDSPTVSPAPQMQENDVENTSACPSSEDTGSESSEEGPQAGAFSPETCTTEKLKFMLHRTKRLRSFRGIENREDNPTSVSPKVTTSSTSMGKPDEQDLDEGAEEEDAENGLSRAIAMLALALEKLKSKVKLLTGKKSFEILTSVAERIHAQLHSVESQIQTDTCKLTSLSNQKRKRLETQFHEQEEQLKGRDPRARKQPY